MSIHFAKYSFKQVKRFMEMGALSELPEERKYQIGFNWSVASMIIGIEGWTIIKSAIEKKDWTPFAKYVSELQETFGEYKGEEFKETEFVAVDSELARVALSTIEVILMTELSDINKVEIGYLFGQANIILGGSRSMWWNILQKFSETKDSAPLIKACKMYSAATKVEPLKFPVK